MGTPANSVNLYVALKVLKDTFCWVQPLSDVSAFPDLQIGALTAQDQSILQSQPNCPCVHAEKHLLRLKHSLPTEVDAILFSS